MRRAAPRFVAAASASLLALSLATAAQAAGATAAPAQKPDFYVLSLSWSPSYCVTAGKRASRQQCGPDKHFGFVVHGLWPQSETGRIENCRSSEPARVPASLGRTYFDIMPSMSLIGHEWRTHGTCSGLSQTDYFALIRKARAAVAIPPDFTVRPPARERPATIERAFLSVNPGLHADGIAVACARSRLQEVRLCMTRDLAFRSCPAVDAAACPLPEIGIPAPH